MEHKAIRAIISGGGTGGHIFPAISIANKLKELNPDTEILFVGAEGKMEMEKVPAAGYEIKGLPVAGLQRRMALSNFALPVKIAKSISMAGKIIDGFKPDIAIGVGGYASAPLLWKASMKGIPTERICGTHQQDSREEGRKDLCGIRRDGKILPRRKDSHHRESDTQGNCRTYS